MPEFDVEVHVSSVLAMVSGGNRVFHCRGFTVRDVFEDLFIQAPSLRVHVLDEKDEVRQHVLVFVGDENLKWLGGLDAELTQPIQITVHQAVSGG